MASYDYWVAALRLTDGKRQLTRPEMASLGVSEDNPGSGFYRVRLVPRGPFDGPVAIWVHEGQPVATLAGMPADLTDTWLHACRFPIHERIYRTYMETGLWPVDEKVTT